MAGSFLNFIQVQELLFLPVEPSLTTPSDGGIWQTEEVSGLLFMQSWECSYFKTPFHHQFFTSFWSNFSTFSFAPSCIDGNFLFKVVLSFRKQRWGIISTSFYWDISILLSTWLCNLDFLLHVCSTACNHVQLEGKGCVQREAQEVPCICCFSRFWKYVVVGFFQLFLVYEDKSSEDYDDPVTFYDKFCDNFYPQYSQVKAFVMESSQNYW